jgi:hypothetical protein
MALPERLPSDGFVGSAASVAVAENAMRIADRMC